MTEKSVYIVIGCDSDPDRADFVDNLPADALSWRGMLEGIPRAKERLQQIHDSDGKMPIFTWCLRVDYQIKKLHGAYNYFLKQHKDFLLDLEKEGDELAWHPHFWNYDEALDLWYQDCYNVEWQVQMLKETDLLDQHNRPAFLLQALDGPDGKEPKNGRQACLRHLLSP